MTLTRRDLNVTQNFESRMFKTPVVLVEVAPTLEYFAVSVTEFGSFQQTLNEYAEFLREHGYEDGTNEEILAQIPAEQLVAMEEDFNKLTGGTNAHTQVFETNAVGEQRVDGDSDDIFAQLMASLDGPREVVSLPGVQIDGALDSLIKHLNNA